MDTPASPPFYVHSVLLMLGDGVELRRMIETPSLKVMQYATTILRFDNNAPAKDLFVKDRWGMAHADMATNAQVEELIDHMLRSRVGRR